MWQIDSLEETTLPAESRDGIAGPKANFERNNKIMSATFTDENFDSLVLRSNKLCIVDFWATWCSPCIALGPTIDSLSNDFEEQVNVGKLNIDENPEVSIKYGVTNIPCVLFIKNGEIVDKQIGVAPKSVYQEKVKKLLQV